MSWIDALGRIEDLEDAEFDAGLVARMEQNAHLATRRPIRFSTPTFKEYASSELQGCGKNSFPAFSITAGACGLNCDHCQKKILEPMIPATDPAMLDTKVRAMIDTEGLNGFLLSGGSNKKNEIPYGRYLPVVEKLKHDFPDLKIAIHSALLDERRAKAMEAAGVDTVMMDVIGAEETIQQVYKLNRPVDDFESTLAALCSTNMEVTPHIVIGLHYGQILGEANALDIVSRYPVTALVLVVIMPFYAKAGNVRHAGYDRRRHAVCGGARAARGQAGAARLRPAARHAQAGHRRLRRSWRVSTASRSRQTGPSRSRTRSAGPSSRRTRAARSNWAASSVRHCNPLSLPEQNR